MEFKKQFVCREHEITHLRTRLIQVQDKKIPWITFIRGDYGEGKTSLIENFFRTIKQTNPQVFSVFTACYKNNDTSSSWPFADILQELSKLNLGNKSIFREFLQWLKDVAPPMVDVFSAGYFSVAVKTLQATLAIPNTRRGVFNQENIFDRFLMAFKAMVHNKTILIAIDDIHFADETTLDLLVYLIKNLRASSIYFLISFRPYEVFNNKRNRLSDIRAELLNVQADEVSIEQGILVSRYLENQFGLPVHLINEIQDYTGGHPENIEYLLEKWIMQAYLIPNPLNKYVLADPQNDEFPIFYEARGDIRGERIKDMPLETRRVLEYAAVLGIVGDRFPFEPLAQMVNLPGDMVSEIIEDLETKFSMIKFDCDFQFDETNEKATGSIKSNDNSQTFEKPISPSAQMSKVTFYRFLRHCVPDYILKGITGHRRKALHQKAIEVLPGFYPDTTVIAQQLASHHAACDDHDLAAKYALLAGSIEHAKFSWAESEKWCKFGLKEIERLAVGKDSYRTNYQIIQLRFDLKQLYAQAAFNKGDYDHSVKIFEEAVHDGLENNLDPIRITSCLNFLAYACFYLCETSKVENYVVRAENLIKDVAEISEVKIDLLIAKSMVYFYKEDLQEYVRLLNYALEKADELPKTETLDGLRSDAYNFLGIAYVQLGYFKKSVEAYQTAVLIDQSYENMRTEAMHQLNIADAYVAQGEFEKSTPPLEVGLNLAFKIGDKDSISYAYSLQGIIQSMHGKYNHAIRDLYQAIKYANECGSKWNLGHIYARLAENFLQTNKINEAGKYLKLANQFNNDGEPADTNLILSITAKLEEARGNELDAEKAFNNVIQKCLPERKWVAATYQSEYAEFLIRRKNYDAALLILEGAAKVLEQYDSSFYLQKALDLMDLVRKKKYEEN
jgi:tetratricopeptide (TPR) repeat protein